MSQITIRKNQGVSIIVIDDPDSKLNTITEQLGDELDAALTRIEGDASCAGVVLISGKPDSFIVGANIDQLTQLKTAADAEQISRKGQRWLDRLEAIKVPVVAAIHGSALGGGLELAMACHARVCSDSPKTKVGLPEIQLGLIPGAGGTQRLPRLVGIQVGLDMILTGRNLRPKKARKLGLIDEVVPQAALEVAAIGWIKKLAKKKNKKRSRGLAPDLKELKGMLDSKELTELLLSGNPLGRAFVFKKGRETVQSKTRGHYPAAFAALRAVETGLAKGIKAGLAAEAKEFGQLVVSDVSKALTGIYFDTQSIKKDSGVASDAKPRTISRLGILGGGLMGGGIAYISSKKGVDVRIKERDPESGAKALGAVWDLLKGDVKRKRVTRPEAEVLMSHISATDDLSGFGPVEMVIEAVFEDLELKQRLLEEVEARTDERCIFASNTSSLPITKIAAASKRPETVLGMHFFSPVHKMPLLEIIVTGKTSDEVTTTAVAFGKRLGKQTIVVSDGVGFYTSRILAPYMNEAASVLAEGASIDAIDRAMLDFGYPVGPIALMDEVGIDVGAKVAKIMFDAYGERMKPVEQLQAVLDDNRFGRKNRRGFYLYGDKKKGSKKQVDESVYGLLPGGKKRQPINVEEVQLRIALQMVNEAAHCLGEGILRNPRDGDIGAIFGLGFPPFFGGPFRYIDRRGAQAVVDDLQRLRDRFGARFEPAAALHDAARNNRVFREDR